MDFSSPLAAMHRPAAAPFGQKDLFRGNRPGHLSPGKPRAAGGFNLRAQLRSNLDYFSKPVVGSSPAGSLAADLGQNFQISDDVSPPLATPRRALFTASHMAAAEGRGFVTTPPLPASSSPAAMHEMMDISPLPLKGPMVLQVEIQSPTPVPTPDEMPDEIMMVESPDDLSPLEPPKPPVAERRKSSLRRPSLSRAKGYTTGGMPGRLHADSQLANFRFGGSESRLTVPSLLSSASSSLSLSECFEGSPPHERRPQTSSSSSINATAGGVVRQRPHFSSLSSATAAARNGVPPNAGHARRPSNPFVRPRRQYRRSLSMFENPGDMIKPKKESDAQLPSVVPVPVPVPVPALAAVMDMEEPHEPRLPHFFHEDQSDTIPRIQRSTLLEVLDGNYNEHYDNKLVIDCRFEYEYEGGHISEAINYNDKELLATHLFKMPMTGRTLLIFHCEYSAHRAPMMARHIRAEDRTANAECYPKLTYPEVYILAGGYSGFFEEHPARCYPQAYVGMDAAEHAFTCEREMGRLRQNRKGLHRAQTFAFGQHGRSVDDSPSAPGRRAPACDPPQFVLGASPVLGSDRCHARRMASY